MTGDCIAKVKEKCRSWKKYLKMQLDVGSEPTLWFAHVTCIFLDRTYLKSHMRTYILDNYVDGSNSMVLLFAWKIWILLQSEFLLQTDRQTDGQKVTPMSPPCNMHRWAQKTWGSWEWGGSTSCCQGMDISVQQYLLVFWCWYVFLVMIYNVSYKKGDYM